MKWSTCLIKFPILNTRETTHASACCSFFASIKLSFHFLLCTTPDCLSTTEINRQTVWTFIIALPSQANSRKTPWNHVRLIPSNHHLIKDRDAHTCLSSYRAVCLDYFSFSSSFSCCLSLSMSLTPVSLSRNCVSWASVIYCMKITFPTSLLLQSLQLTHMWVSK